MGTWIEARPKVAIPGVFDSMQDEAHITMVYLGDADHDAVVDMMQAQSGQLYAGNTWPQYGPVICEVSGTAQWRDANNKLFRVALVVPAAGVSSIETLYSIRDRMVSKIKAMSGEDERPVVSVNDDYPFIPHITLPPRFQEDNKKTCDHGTPYSMHLPVIHARTMFIVDKFYVSSGTAHDPDSYKHTEI